MLCIQIGSYLYSTLNYYNVSYFICFVKRLTGKHILLIRINYKKKLIITFDFIWLVYLNFEGTLMYDCLSIFDCIWSFKKFSFRHTRIKIDLTFACIIIHFWKEWRQWWMVMDYILLYLQHVLWITYIIYFIWINF